MSDKERINEFIEAEKAEDAGTEGNKITPVEKTATATGRRATTNYKVVSKVEETKTEAKAE